MENKSFEEYKEWLDNSIRLNQESSISILYHLLHFTKKYRSNLGLDIIFYNEKLFNTALEVKLLDIAQSVLKTFKAEFGENEKVKRMQAELLEIDSEKTDSLQNALSIYKQLIHANQEDRQSVKCYLGIYKVLYSFENMKSYIELLNEYLHVYMDDQDVWYELSDMYILANNLNKAIYCLEEVLLHQPNNINIYNKLGDILCSFTNTESAVSAIKYYSQSLLIKETPKAFWGIVYAINVIYKYNKTLDDKFKSLLFIAKAKLEEYYPKDFKFENFYNIKV
jgi:tetratricopeptide (TPR) repeat protein